MIDALLALHTAPASSVLKRTKSGTTRFGTSDVRDLSDGTYPLEIWRVDVREDASAVHKVGDQVARHEFTVRTERQRDRRVKEAQSGWRIGWKSHVEIRNGRRSQPSATP